MKNDPIEENKPWTTEDQSEPDRLDADIIHILDTEIGIQTKKFKISTKNSKKRNSFKSVNISTSRRSLNIKPGVCGGSQSASLVWGYINMVNIIS